MKKVLTAAQMQEADRTAMDRFGIPGLVLMENAGRGIVDSMTRHFPELQNQRVFVFCGKGNNGGDGFVIARHLHNRGIRVEIGLIGKRRALKGDAAVNAKIAYQSGIAIHELSDRNLNSIQHTLRHSQIVVDALFGTGLTRPAEGVFAKAIEKINASGNSVVAVDIPSGIDSDSGQLMGPHVQAYLTTPLAEYKRSHCLYPAREAMGHLELVDIGMPPALKEKLSDTVELLEESDLVSLFPRRRKMSHKGTYGHLLVIAGSRGKGGAAGLTALAGLRAGAGLVTLAAPESLVPALEFHPMESMTLALPETDTGEIHAEAVEVIRKSLKGKTALAVGPGLGTHDSTIRFMESLLPDVSLPLVIDADGLNCLARSKKRMRQVPRGTVLTPHPKEMSRLAGIKVDDILKQKLDVARTFARKHRVTLVLKGAGSLIAQPGGKIQINPTGNPGLATGGSGDVLTGIIGGLMAQGLSPADAAMAGVYLHGWTADAQAGANSETTLIAGDLLRSLPDVLRRILP